MFPFQPPFQQQFYASVMQAWPAGGAYFDIISGFQVNGLPPQQFKQNSYRSNTRSRKVSRSNMHNEQPSQNVASGRGGVQGNQNQSQVPPSVSPQSSTKGNNSTSKGMSLIGDASKTSRVYNLPSETDVHTGNNAGIDSDEICTCFTTDCSFKAYLYWIQTV